MVGHVFVETLGHVGYILGSSYLVGTWDPSVARRVAVLKTSKGRINGTSAGALIFRCSTEGHLLTRPLIRVNCELLYT